VAGEGTLKARHPVPGAAGGSLPQGWHLRGGFSLFSGHKQRDHPTTIYSQVQAAAGSHAETLA